MRARTEFQASRFQAFCQAAPRARACSARCSGRQVRGCRRRIGVGHAFQAFTVDAAHAAPGQVVERDLIRLAGLARAEKEAAVAAPVRLDLDVDLEVLVFLVGQENPALAARILGADDQPVEHVVVGRRPVVVRLADVPAGQILAVEDRRESFRHLRTVVSRGHLIHVGRWRRLGGRLCGCCAEGGRRQGRCDGQPRESIGHTVCSSMFALAQSQMVTGLLSAFLVCFAGPHPREARGAPPPRAASARVARAAV